MEHDRKQRQPINNSKPETKKHIKIRKKSEFSVLGSKQMEFNIRNINKFLPTVIVIV